MGFDLYGVRARSGAGDYFRNNIWWWRPLWDYVCDEMGTVLTKKDKGNGYFNDGHKISETKADKIAETLEKLLKSGRVADYARRYRSFTKKLQACVPCGGTGKREDLRAGERCDSCQGSGRVLPQLANYPFSVANVREFAKFCAESGGFTIN